MKFIYVTLVCLLAGCGGTDKSVSTAEVDTSLAQVPAVCRLQSPQIAGSLIPLGNQHALTARHLLHQPVVRVDGQLTGIDAIHDGRGGEVTAGDWAIVQINDTRLPPPDARVARYEFPAESPVFLCGFPTASPHPSRPSVYRASVQKPPFWVPREDGLVILSVDGSPDLSGMSGGSVVIPGADGTGWQVVGIYLGRLQSAGWTGYVVRPLPLEVEDSGAGSPQNLNLQK